MKINKKFWPVLIVSSQFHSKTDEGFRLKKLATELTENQECAVIASYTYEDASEVFISRADIGAIVIDWDIPSEGLIENMRPDDFLNTIRLRNKKVPVILLTDRLEMENIPVDVLKNVNGCMWKTADTTEFLAGRIEIHLIEYVKQIYPRFFGELVDYAEDYKYAWHTPGHMGGLGFLRSPAGVAMHKFFGENTFRSDLSISVPELGSLLDHSGVCGDAERNSARVFGADQTYYVLNGTSNVNQIIWRSQVLPDDVAIVDRNCHKSLNYAMVITEAVPLYMVPRRNRRGIIGPVRLEEFDPAHIQKRMELSPLIPDAKRRLPAKIAALTNSTYDGVCYNVATIKKHVGMGIENLHFDEAWYAYAKFNPIYAGHFGMTDDSRLPNHPPIFCAQSTHKLLTAFSQASMLHIREGGTVKINPDEFNESYMMHGSTSPQYNMIASLDVATKMMEDNGEIMLHDIICEAISLRKKVAKIERELKRKNSDDWFFGMWQPKEVSINGKWVPFEDVDTEYLATNQDVWVMDRVNNWHGFDDIEPHYAMLDPLKLTFTTPGIDDNGNFAATGIPADVLTAYLVCEGIVCEKTDYYSFLLLNSLGTTKAKQGSLLAALLKFKSLYDENALLDDVLPELVAAHPRYADVGLRDHCHAIHAFYAESGILDRMLAAFQTLPDPAMRPSAAYREVVRRNVEYVDVDKLDGRTAAVMIVPYPPGIPIIMGGERFGDKGGPVQAYLKLRQDFENKFPGYQSDIHGIVRERRADGRSYFKTLCLKE